MQKYLAFFIWFCGFSAMAQPKLRLQDCEAQFLKNNLYLLAEHYNIDAAQAQVIQARLWENPYVAAELNAANPQQGKVFDVQRSGQKAFAIQQLVYLGGKKKYEAEVAKANADAAELIFSDLMRTLRFQLRTSFFSVYYDAITEAVLDKQLVNLDSLIRSYDAQVQKGNLPLKDLVRLQSLYMDMANERTEVVQHIIEEQSRLAVLISADGLIIPAPSADELEHYQKALPVTLYQLQQTALQNRADLLLANKNKEAAQWNARWQRSLGVPDLTVGASYDQRGGAFNNQVNLTLGMPLRLWNKNQGNIKVADVQVRQAMLHTDIQVQELRSEVNAAYLKYNEAKKNMELVSAAVRQHFDDVYNGMYRNFIKRNVTLIEFTDFMESYNQSLRQFNQISKSLTNACEEINYTTGSIIF